jgi:F0F1-type ATP synthase assembly protein I
MDSFLEFLGTFPLGLLVFLVIGFVVCICGGLVLMWIVSKITGKTMSEIAADRGTGQTHGDGD